MALSITQLAAITHRLIVPKAVDNIFASNPLLFRFKEKGIRYEGGRTIVQPLANTDLTTTTEYEGAEILPTSLNENLTGAEYQWRQYTSLFGVTGREEIQNAGKSAILNLLDTKRKICELSLLNKLGTDLQGSNSSGKALDGLGNFLSASTTHGGIAVADMANWIARVRTLSVAGTLTLFEMQKAFGAAVIGSEHPTVIVTRQSVYDKLWSLYQPDQRFNDSKMADAGFGGLKFNGIPIVVDSHVTGTDGGNQDNWVEMLNENYLGLVTHSSVNFKVVPIPTLKDQDVKLIRILWAGNMWASARWVHSVIKTVDPNL